MKQLYVTVNCYPDEKDQMLCKRLYWQSTVFKVLCPKPWSTEEFVRKCKLFVFNISTDNSIVESLAWIIFPEICSDKSWKLTEICYFYQIETGIKIFKNKNCKITFGFQYILIHHATLIEFQKPGLLARSDACPPGNQTFTGSIPGPAHSFVEIWSWNYFYGHSLPTTDSSRAVVSCWRNRMCT